MLGSALKKLASENNMKIAKGVAYGAFRGYAAVMDEGNGYKRLAVSTRFPDAARMHWLREQVFGLDLKRTYRVTSLEITERWINVVFWDNPGTMKKIHAFLDWFFPLLDQAQASKADVCNECGGEITGGKWVMIEGIAYHLHESCADKLDRMNEEEKEVRQANDEGTYLRGLLGAFAGSVLGAAAWAAVMLWGYITALGGLLIGWLAEKGYDLFRGKQGKGKILILILAVLFGVLCGTFAADAFSLGQMIAQGELPGFAYTDIPSMLLLLLIEEPEYATSVGKNILMGLLFAALGVYALIAKAGKEVVGTRIVELE